MESQEAQNFFKAWGVVFASLLYCYLISSNIPKGIDRLFSLFPVMSLFVFLPLSVSSPLSALTFTGFITWLCNFKLLLFAFDQGPLTEPGPQNSLFKFILFAAFPIKLRNKNEKLNAVLGLNLWSKILLFALFNWLHDKTKNLVVFGCWMCLFIDINFGVSDVLVKATLGLELDPPSDEPYLSTSLQDFWGRRWNRMMSDALRTTIYMPVKSVAVDFVGRKWANVVALMAAFLVSGFIHELTFYYMTRATPTWEVTCFFVLHGVCVVLETMVKRALGPKWRLPWFVSAPLTVGFVLVTASWLFFPHLIRNHVDTRSTEDVVAIGSYFKQMISR